MLRDVLDSESVMAWPRVAPNRQIRLRSQASTEVKSTGAWSFGFCDPNS